MRVIGAKKRISSCYSLCFLVVDLALAFSGLIAWAIGAENLL